jgi:hypothetical protein
MGYVLGREAMSCTSEPDVVSGNLRGGLRVAAAQSYEQALVVSLECCQ